MLSCSAYYYLVRTHSIIPGFIKYSVENSEAEIKVSDLTKIFPESIKKQQAMEEDDDIEIKQSKKIKKSSKKKEEKPADKKSQEDKDRLPD